MKKGKTEIIYNEKTKQWHVLYIVANNKILASSETFKTKNGAKKNIAAMRKLFS